MEKCFSLRRATRLEERLEASLDGPEELVERSLPTRGASRLEESVEKSANAAKHREGGGEEGGRG